MNLIRYSHWKIDFKKYLLLADLNFDGNRHGLKHKHYALFSISWFAPLCEIDHIVIHQKWQISKRTLLLHLTFHFRKHFVRFRFHQEEDGFEAELLQHPQMSLPLRHTFPGWLQLTYL